MPKLKKYVAEVHRKLVREYIKKNPDNGVKDFERDHSIHMTNVNFGMLKKNTLGKKFKAKQPRTPEQAENILKKQRVGYQEESPVREKRPYREKKPVYKIVWQKNSEDISNEALELFKDFVNSLGLAIGSRFEMKQYIDPATIEIRETA